MESLEEAVQALAMACGGKKAFAALLRPDIDDEATAHKWLLEVLSPNPDRRVVFHAAHLLKACKLGRARGIHVLKHWFDEAAGYEPTGIIPAKTPNQVRAERMTQLLAEFKHLADEEAAEQAEEKLRSVR